MATSLPGTIRLGSTVQYIANYNDNSAVTTVHRAGYPQRWVIPVGFISLAQRYSILTQRFRVSGNGVLSDPLPLKFGIPQGSVLAPVGRPYSALC